MGTDNSIKVKKVATTIHHTKQPQLSVRVSMIESLNEEIEIKLSVRVSMIESLNEEIEINQSVRV